MASYKALNTLSKAGAWNILDSRRYVDVCQCRTVGKGTFPEGSDRLWQRKLGECGIIGKSHLVHAGYSVTFSVSFSFHDKSLRDGYGSYVCCQFGLIVAVDLIGYLWS